MNRTSERETLVELPWAAGSCPCVEKLRAVLPFTVGIRDGVVHLVPTLGGVIGGAASTRNGRAGESPLREGGEQGGRCDATPPGGCSAGVPTRPAGYTGDGSRGRLWKTTSCLGQLHSLTQCSATGAPRTPCPRWCAARRRRARRRGPWRSRARCSPHSLTHSVLRHWRTSYSLPTLVRSPST
jgi:hypothetical protein